ncbi:conserved hypothetical protein [Burkholderiales bacterium 8X]|nr:conserved hypothetical protein [Burkholderiales bacterium 8X]
MFRNDRRASNPLAAPLAALALHLVQEDSQMKNAAALTQRRSGDQQGSEGLDFTATSPQPLMFLARKQQHQLILRELRVSPKTTDMLRALGVFMPNSRIHEIRSFGISVRTDLVRVVGIDGRLRKMALYTLNEPADHWSPAGER